MYQRLLKEQKKRRDEKCAICCIFCKEIFCFFSCYYYYFFFIWPIRKNQSTRPGVRIALEPISFPSSKIQALNSFKLLRAGYCEVRCF